MKKLLFLLAAIIVTSACTSVGLTGRRQMMLLNTDDERQMGQQAYDQVLKTSKISQNAKATALVKKVGQKIAAAADTDFDWEFVLIEDSQVNAFCLPGGKVAVYTGILPYTKNEEGLAVVLAHEVGHAVARHGAERASQQMILQGGTSIASLALGSNPNSDLIMSAFGVASNVGIMLPYSRKHEHEADIIGLILMAKAGYNPQAAVEFWKTMAAKTGGQGNSGVLSEFLSTHPSDQKRIDEIQKNMPKAMAYYKKP